MQDPALLESVSELVTLAGDGIHSALTELPPEANEADLNSALEACQGNVETIAMAADMAQLTGLQQLCDAVNEQLGALNGHVREFQTDLGSRLIDWSQAVQLYIHQPDANGITEPLLALVPSNQRAQLRFELGGDEAEPSESENTLVASAAPELAELESSDSEDVPVTSAESELTEPERDESELEVIAPDQQDDGAAGEFTTAIEEGPETDTAEAVEAAFAAVMGVEASITPAMPESEQPESIDDTQQSITAADSLAEDNDDSVDTIPVEDAETADVVTFEAVDGLGTSAAPDGYTEAMPEVIAIESDDEPELTEFAEPSSESELYLDTAESASPAEPDELSDYEVAPASAVESADSAVVDDASEWAELDGSDEEAFEDAASAQFNEIFAELEPWRAVLQEPTASQDDLHAACAGYRQAIERVQAAGAALGLSGLGVVCELLDQNIQALPAADPAARAEAAAQLTNWPTIAKMYLQAPEDESHQMALLELVMHESWPHPLTHDQAEEFLAVLAPDEDEYLAEVEDRPTVAQPEDVTLVIDPDVNPKLVEVFLQEAPVNAANFTASLERVMRGEDIVKNLANAQRLAHNLKGSANLVGVKGVANLTHHIEDILEYLTEHQQAPHAALANTLQEAADCVEAMLEAVHGAAEALPDAQRILQDVLDWAKRMDAGQLDDPVEAIPAEATAVATQPEPVVEAASPAVPATTAVEEVAAEAPEAAQAGPQAATPGKMLRVPTDTIDALFRMVGEISIALDQVQEHIQTTRRRSNELHAQDNIVQQRRFELENFIDVRHLAGMQQRFSRLGRRQDFDPLELDQYDELYSTTRSFIETVMDSRRMAQNLRGELSGLEHILAPLRRMKSDLQNAVMKVRMEPVDTISARLQRSVRQACRATGKQAELHIEGGTTLLDNEVLDKLADPLMHMLRNAVDHGIETPEQRRARGKPETGTIRLRFFQEGQNVVVECSDDGRGLDYESIRRTALARGLQANAANPQELARMILLPGFSTRTSATQLSGRGVGMDVVQETIRELKGVMEIGDAAGGGCRIALRLPITLMTSHSLVIKVKGEQYAIPTSSVMRVLSPRDGQFTQVGTTMAYEIGQDAYPAASLASLLGLASDEADELRPDSSVLLVYSDTGPVAVAVDQLMNSYHLVLKSLGRYITSVRGISGLSNLADGSLIPVLDLAELLRSPTQHAMSKTSAAVVDVASGPTERRAAVRVLIVDDSLSVRQSLSELMEDAGYHPIVARDGVEAVDMLRKQTPDIVLSDIEMPRMNGLELVNYIRTTHSAELPVIMITSRTMQKHRQQAEQAGANGYVTKPFNEDALLESVRALLN